MEIGNINFELILRIIVSKIKNDIKVHYFIIYLYENTEILPNVYVIRKI